MSPRKAARKAAAVANARRASKVQRWTDLLAALLSRQFPVPFEVLIENVPAYSAAASRSKESLRRTFERDKDELRAFGIPITTVTSSDGETVGYKLATKEFYLPYLHLVSTGRSKSGARRVDRDGYRALPSLAFEPDELAAVTQAIARVRQLGDPLLADAAESAARKLAFDLPLDAAAPAGNDEVFLEPRAKPDDTVFAALGDALLRRKRVTFTYHAIGTDTTSTRSVEPYGLFFIGAHWYLAGRDVDKRELRNFRLSRISNVDVNAARALSADYDVPADFSLREHARSRSAWELGGGDGSRAVIEFTGSSGAAQAAARLGVPVAGEPSRREFHVRRVDAFVRWLLSLAGDARPVEPPALAEELRRQARRTLELYRPA